jgi:hypothetical protein
MADLSSVIDATMVFLGVASILMMAGAMLTSEDRTVRNVPEVNIKPANRWVPQPTEDLKQAA